MIARRVGHDKSETARLLAEKGGNAISDVDAELSEASFEMFGRDGLDAAAVPLADRRASAVALDDNTAIYDEVGHVLIMLNPGASAVWELCDGSATAGEIVSRLAEGYAAAKDEIRTDVWLTLLKLASLGLLSDAR